MSYFLLFLINLMIKLAFHFFVELFLSDQFELFFFLVQNCIKFYKSCPLIILVLFLII